MAGAQRVSPVHWKDFSNFFKRARRVQQLVPSYCLEWDKLKSYLKQRFPYYRLNLEERWVCQRETF